MLENYIGKIFNCDCFEIMKQLPDKCVLTITDPPYGIKMSKISESVSFCRGTLCHRKGYDDIWDFERLSKRYFDEILRISSNVVIFGGNYFSDLLPQNNHWIVWDKKQYLPTRSNCELIYTSFPKNTVKKIEIVWNGCMGNDPDRINRRHPTQKPLKLLKQIISEYVLEEEIVFDPFAGSGTTLVAAEELGRLWFGCEKEEKYCKISEQRISDLKQQLNLRI